jgi:hypothetical protein
MVILAEVDYGSPRLVVVYFRLSGQAASPVEKEYHGSVKQPKERAKIDALLKNLSHFGFKTPGIRFEKIKGAKAGIYELKIKAFGSEHRFLAGYALTRTREGLPVLILLKYAKKKQWKLDRTDIQTAVSRLAATGEEIQHGQE